MVTAVTIHFVTIKGFGTDNMEQEFRLDCFIPYRLMVAAEKVSLGFSAIYKEQYGMSRPEWRVLASLAQLQRATAKAIASHSSMHKTKVSRAVFELEKRKWLLRKLDEADRRMEHLSLTKAGIAVHAKLAVHANAYQAKLFAQLGAASSDQLLTVLEKLDGLHVGQGPDRV
jgi:DNA-binding MarR family transcriptional regulator